MNNGSSGHALADTGVTRGEIGAGQDGPDPGRLDTRAPGETGRGLRLPQGIIFS